MVAAAGYGLQFFASSAVGSGLHLSERAISADVRAISADGSWQAAFDSPTSFCDSSFYEPVYEPEACVPARMHVDCGSAVVRRIKDPGKSLCDSVIESAHPSLARFHDPG